MPGKHKKEHDQMTQSHHLPELFNVQDVFRGAYAARLEAFAEAGRLAPLSAADEDREKVALILVDYQHDFIDPTGTLYVPGSQDDIARLLTWFYHNAHKITSVYASLDTHLPYQIFFGSWWKNPETGAHPQPYTTIGIEDIESKRWVAVLHPEWSLHYVRQLQKQAKKDLMIWPFHTMQGTLGHMLAAPISEAIVWHSAARSTQPIYITKGLTPRTEYYGIFGAEVPDPEDTGSNLNAPMLNTIMAYDRVYIAGEAKSHCVLETERQLVTYLAKRPELLHKLYLLTDCTSSVQHPNIDFDAIAEQELAEMGSKGAHLTLSTAEI
jgi:nicotinamidase/pyrazinamidase